jgi:hypothetical protein
VTEAEQATAQGPTGQLGQYERVKASWSIKHFSQANPAGPDQANIPALLRRIAESIDQLGPVDVQDLILHEEITAEGPWPSITVYFHPTDRPSST